jgi:CheY-like chemotaxis protein
MKSPAKILVVDDTPRNVKLLADLLAIKGYEVVTAASGREDREAGSGAVGRGDAGDERL